LARCRIERSREEPSPAPHGPRSPQRGARHLNPQHQSKGAARGGDANRFCWNSKPPRARRLIRRRANSLVYLAIGRNAVFPDSLYMQADHRFAPKSDGEIPIPVNATLALLLLKDLGSCCPVKGRSQQLPIAFVIAMNYSLLTLTYGVAGPAS